MSGRSTGPGTSEWPDFTETAERQFWALPEETIDAFATVFPEFVRHPTRASTTVDVVPIDGDPHRWRLKVLGFRALFHLRHGWPLIEQVEPRTYSTYARFQDYIRSHPLRY